MIQPKITFRDFPPSDAVRTAIESRAEKLDRLFDRILSCEVVVSAPHRHRHADRNYHVQIHLGVSGPDIFIDREPEQNDDHTDIYVAIRDAFDAAERKLQDHARKMRGEVKHHELISGQPS